MISPHGVFISYQANVDAMGNNIVGDAANECSISVDPTDGNKMAIGWRQFNSVLSNFRQGGWGYTTDGGVHWSDEVRLSDLGSGAPYKTADGYVFPYGDYFGIAADASGTNFVIWGEGTGRGSGGGCWFTKGA